MHCSDGPLSGNLEASSVKVNVGSVPKLVSPKGRNSFCSPRLYVRGLPFMTSIYRADGVDDPQEMEKN